VFLQIKAHSPSVGDVVMSTGFTASVICRHLSFVSILSSFTEASFMLFEHVSR